MTIHFELETIVDAPIETVFDLSLDIDLHRSSMAASRERAIAGVTSGRIGLGETVTWRAVHFGIPFTMTSRVTELERPRRFVDEQVRGPFRRFHHEHLFEPSGSETRMIDRVRFDAPLGPVGRMVERMLLGAYLEKLIVIRNDHLREVAESEGRDAIGDVPATGSPDTRSR